MSASARARPHLHAPALQFRLLRSPRLGGVLAVLSVPQLVLLLLWALGDESTTAGFKLFTAITLWSLTTAAAFHWWSNAREGTLRWDGLQWEWRSPSGAAVLLESLCVTLDFQSTLLVQARHFGSARGIHLWLERESDPLHWLALRRAVYSRAIGELSPR
ncbi:hypothetical protein [Diaphorobacter caeni]|uniref:hypothetical protein n=1 Tax=Diaphorobacter caeni TaxID=2784387 RepID=UPI00188DCE26|nr:hypothetical protein [Diaphorobacter caeni]MBF5003254.1 hypothetical protein [Diaphorobacter caeni]